MERGRSVEPDKRSVTNSATMLGHRNMNGPTPIGTVMGPFAHAIACSPAWLPSQRSKGDSHA